MKTIQITIRANESEQEWITTVLDSYGIDYDLDIIDHDKLTIERIHKVVSKAEGLPPESLFEKTKTRINS